MSEAALSAEELAALRDASQGLANDSGAHGAAAGAPGASDAGDAGAGYKVIQLAAPDRQARRRLPALQPQLAAVMRRHRQVVSEVMRTSLDVTIAAPDVCSVAQMSAEVTAWLYGAVLRLKSHGEPIAWVGLPVELGFHLVEIAFGGVAGKPGACPPKRQLTAIEKETLWPFVLRVAETCIDELHFARMGEVEITPLTYPLSFGGLRTQEAGVRLRVDVPVQGGTLPYTMVLLPKALECLEPEGRSEAAQAKHHDAQTMVAHAAAARVEIVAKLGELQVPLSEVVRLKPGHVIWLEHNQSEPIELLVEGQVKFTAMPMQRAGAIGVAIVETVEPRP